MKNNSSEIIVCISLIIILIGFVLYTQIQIHISNQIRTLNDNTELLINRTDTILTILQD